MIITRRPPRIVVAHRSSTPRLSVFIRDASKRSVFADPQVLVRFSIDAANADLMGRFL